MPVKILAAAAGLGACAFGGAALASGASSASKDSTTTIGTTTTPATPRGVGTPETPLTGDALAKVTAAAVAKAGGSVDLATTENDSSNSAAVYEAHVTKADGSHATVILDKDYNVLAVETGGPGGFGPGGPGFDRGGRGGHGPGGGPGNGETPLTGETATKAKAAAVAKVGGTADLATTETDSSNSAAAFEVHVTKTDGSHATVILDKDFNVLGVETGPQHGPPAQQSSGTGTVQGFFRGH